MTDKHDTFVGIDMNGAQTRCLVAAADGPALRFLSCGSMPPIRWDDDDLRTPQLTPEAVLEAVCEAEHDGGLTVHSAVVGLGGAQVRSSMVHSTVRLTLGQRTVEMGDVANVIRRAAAGLVSTSATVLQLVPLEFVAGDRAGLQNPVGYPADRLDAYVRLISTHQAEHDAVRRVVNNASISVEETVLAGFASAYCTLSQAEVGGGVAHLEIGKNSSTLTAYCGGGLRLATGLPVGRDHLVGDVSRAFATDPSVASSLIADFGSAAYSERLTGAYVFVPGSEVSSSPAQRGRLWPRDMLDKIIALRVEECLTLVHDELRHEGLANGSVSSLVITGDAAELPGIRDMAQSIIGLRSRIGVPTRPDNLPAALRSPGWACAAGLVLYAYRLAYRPADAEADRSAHAEIQFEEQVA